MCVVVCIVGYVAVVSAYVSVLYVIDAMCMTMSVQVPLHFLCLDVCVYVCVCVCMCMYV